MLTDLGLHLTDVLGTAAAASRWTCSPLFYASQGPWRLTMDNDFQEGYEKPIIMICSTTNTHHLLKKNKSQDLRKREMKNHQNQKHPQKCSLGFLTLLSRRKTQEISFQESKEVKERKKPHQNKTKNHTHKKTPSRILPSMVFLEPHQ